MLMSAISVRHFGTGSQAENRDIPEFDIIEVWIKLEILR